MQLVFQGASRSFFFRVECICVQSMMDLTNQRYGSTRHTVSAAAEEDVEMAPKKKERQVEKLVPCVPQVGTRACVRGNKYV